MLAHKVKKKVNKEFSTEEKINFLLQPQNYPFHIDKVAVKETHMSLVFLTNGFVYKMKKPVRYDLFDHRSLYSRFINCKEEVKINKQLAKDIYLGLAPLVLNKKKQLQLFEGNIIPALKKNYQIMQLAYEQNTGELFELFDAWQTLNITQFDYLDQLQELLNLQVQMDKTLEQK